jgi:hypothetical protein
MGLISLHSIGVDGELDWLESWADSRGGHRPYMVGDEVESLRPDASLTMSSGALLASSSASRS